jgi:hypothetical protein
MGISEPIAELHEAEGRREEHCGEGEEQGVDHGSASPVDAGAELRPELAAGEEDRDGGEADDPGGPVPDVCELAGDGDEVQREERGDEGELARVRHERCGRFGRRVVAHDVEVMGMPHGVLLRERG